MRGGAPPYTILKALIVPRLGSDLEDADGYNWRGFISKGFRQERGLWFWSCYLTNNDYSSSAGLGLGFDGSQMTAEEARDLIASVRFVDFDVTDPEIEAQKLFEKGKMRSHRVTARKLR